MEWIANVCLFESPYSMKDLQLRKRDALTISHKTAVSSSVT